MERHENSQTVILCIFTPEINPYSQEFIMLTSAEVEHDDALRLEIAAWEKCCREVSCHAVMGGDTSIVLPVEPIPAALNLETQVSEFYVSRKEAGISNETTFQHMSHIDEETRCFAVGFPWLRNHLDELLAAGWTRRELFGRGRYKWPYGYEWGVAWLSSWQDERKTPSVGKWGELVFTFVTSTGDQAQQTAWPASRLKGFRI